MKIWLCTLSDHHADPEYFAFHGEGARAAAMAKADGIIKDYEDKEHPQVVGTWGSREHGFFGSALKFDDSGDNVNVESVEVVEL